MGCCMSGDDDTKRGRQNKIYSWDSKQEVDRKLLSICDQHGGMVVRLPGQLNGRQFKIMNCTSLQVWILDHTNSVMVDNCRDCQIVIAPTKGSLYLRGCERCKCVLACQQFRARGCKNLFISLFASSQPVIEASSSLQFSCFQFYYPQLKDQFEVCGMSVFNNHWSDIHDFDRGVGDDDDTHWTIVTRDSIPKLHLPSESEMGHVGVSFQPEHIVVPYTEGPNSKPDEEAGLIIFLGNAYCETRALQFIGELHRKQVALGLTRRVMLQVHQVQQILPSNQGLFARASQGSLQTVVLEVRGRGSIQLSLEQLGDLVSSDMAYVSPNPNQGMQDILTFSAVIGLSMNM